MGHLLGRLVAPAELLGARKSAGCSEGASRRCVRGRRTRAEGRRIPV